MGNSKSEHVWQTDGHLSKWYLLGAVILTGCGKTAGPSSRPELLDAEIRVADATIQPKQVIVAEGSFRMADDQPHGALTLRIVQKKPDGKTFTHGTAVVKNTDRQANQFSFRQEITAPAVAGDFELHLLHGGKVVSVRPFKTQ